MQMNVQLQDPNSSIHALRTSQRFSAVVKLYCMRPTSAPLRSPEAINEACAGIAIPLDKEQ